MTILPRPTLRRRARGFTLIELMMAMTAGLMVGVAAMALARSSTKVFQEEARITATQLAASLGMSRLSGDLQRAAFLSSPNARKDPQVCSNYLGWTDGGLNTMAGIRIIKNGSYDANTSGLKQSDDNGFQPDSLVIGGSFSTTEQFAVRSIVSSGGTVSVSMQEDSGAMQRARAAAAAGGEPVCGATTTTGIFRPGRFLRVVDAEGRTGFGVITTCTDNVTVVVILAGSGAPQLIERVPTNTCGYRGHATGLLANPVSRVRYAIETLKGHARFGVLVAPPPDATAALVSGDGTTSPSDPGRTELTRVELDEAGQPIAATLELVAEYAVDLEFGITTTTGAGTTPTLQPYPIPMTDAGYLIANTPLTVNAFPERVRSVQVRLSTRARVPDRDGPLSVAGSVGQLGRFQLLGVPGPDNDGDGKVDVFARMRRMQTNVALPNMAGATF